jgi:hypothetical protein
MTQPIPPEALTSLSRSRGMRSNAWDKGSVQFSKSLRISLFVIADHNIQ